jgi:tRNA modification GTPase
MFATETIAALATPKGESAVALVRLSGPLCERLAGELFGRTTPPPARRAMLGTYRDLAGRPVDQCVYTFYAEGASYTGEASLEIIPHGNPLVVRRMLADLIARGCRQADPGEFTRRAFLNDKIDLTEAEAVADLIHARSERAIEVARKQLAGELGRRVSDWTDRLLQVVAELEAYIDFPEEDLPAEDAGSPPARARALAAEWCRAAESSERHAALSRGVRTVILGAPNAGKSSLLNALLGEERALVSPEAGTTRDFISETVAVGPHSLRLVDTAGLRHDAESDIERRGIGKTLEKAAEADFALVVLDRSAPPPALPPEALKFLRPDNALVVLNKTDLPAHPDTDPARIFPGIPTVSLSLLTHDGFDAFRATLVRLLENDGLAPGEDELVVNSRHADALREGAAALDRADALLRRADRPVELAAGEMRGALDRLGDIVGRIDNERMLDRLFATFCIGK